MSIAGGGIVAPAKMPEAYPPRLVHTQPVTPSEIPSVTIPDRPVTIPKSPVTIPDRAVTIVRNTHTESQMVADLYLRDDVGDVGNPTSGMVSQSPDIIMRQAAVANPATSFGDGSGTENNVALSDNVIAGQDHFMNVRT
jgi:hypothetical protein